MAGWTKLGAFAALGVWLGSCGRVDDAQPGVGGGSTNAGGGSGANVGGGAGLPIINVSPTSDAGEVGFYPPPFDESSCSVPVSPSSPGELWCMTRAELQDMRILNLLLDGGVSALGPASHWRCPQLDETSSSGSCGGEGSCCHIPLCGPLAERSSSATSEAGSAGALGDGGAQPDTQLSCYYLDEICGV